MSRLPDVEIEPGAASEGPPEGPSVGARLRAAREAQGLRLAEVAARTRVPLRHLEAIEAGGGALPAEAYSAGFVRAYARLVGLDGDAFARAFRGDAAVAPAPLPPAPPQPVPPQADAPIEQPVDEEEGEEEREGRAARVRLVAAIALAGAGALLLAIALIVGLGGRRDDTSLAVGIPVVVAVPQASQRVRPPVHAAGMRREAAAPAGAIMLTARKRVWMRVYEQNGRTLFSGILRPGQRYVVPPGTRDPRVSTGLPSALAISRDGRALMPLPAPRLVIGAPLDRAPLPGA